MASLEQIQQELQILPQEALGLVYQFIQLLKKTSQPPESNQVPQPSSPPTISGPNATDWSDLMALSAEKSIQSTAQPDDTAAEATGDYSKGSVYEQFKASGLIGCVSIEENLSTTYKQVLAKEWGEKYDHR